MSVNQLRPNPDKNMEVLLVGPESASDSALMLNGVVFP